MFKNINLLVTFECAARHTSYSLAAVELCISQAAVSQQMRTLEQQLGTQLFIRKSRQMCLTQQGHALYVKVQKGLLLINQGLGEIQQQDLAGELTINSTQAFVTLWLMPRLHDFAKQHPNIQIHVTSSASFEDIKSAHLDLAIRFGTQVEKNTPSELICDYFGQSPVFPICSASLAHKLNLQQPKDLLKTWLVSVGNTGPYDWPCWFASAHTNGVDQHTQWTTVASTDMAINAVLSGHGVTLAAPYLCQSQLEKGELVIPVQHAHPNPVKRYFVYDAHSNKIARLRVFMGWLREQMSHATF